MTTRTDPPSAKLARPDQPVASQTMAVTSNKPPTFKEARDGFMAIVNDGIKTAVGKLVASDQFSRSLLTVLNENPDLLKANQMSLAVAVLHAARLGLDLTPALALAYLAPFKVSKKINGRWEKIPMVKLMIGYKGFVLMGRRSGLCNHVSARAVYSRDVFEWEEGLNPNIIHKPHMGEDRGEVIAAYCRGKIIGTGETDFRVVDLPEIEKARRASKGAFVYDEQARRTDFTQPKADSPWTTHFAEMAEKTAIRRFYKGYDLSDFRDLARAIEIDDAYDLGKKIPPPITSGNEQVKPPEQLSESNDWPDFDEDMDDGNAEHIIETTAE